jgi:hypothetical protein
VSYNKLAPVRSNEPFGVSNRMGRDVSKTPLNQLTLW